MNTQIAEKRRQEPNLEIFKIFDTIQGEGPFVGTPATFIRLSGCNLACPLCDTDYTSTRSLATPEFVVDYIKNVLNHGRGRLIVITGGEPFRQEIGPLVEALFSEGFKVQIETNGTLAPNDEYYWSMPGITIVCSPKTPTVNKELQQLIHSYKYVMSADHVGADGLPTYPLDNLADSDRIVARPHEGFRGTVYLQPIDVGDPFENIRHTKAVVDSCLNYGYTLCLQIHKLLNLE